MASDALHEEKAGIYRIHDRILPGLKSVEDKRSKADENQKLIGLGDIYRKKEYDSEIRRIEKSRSPSPSRLNLAKRKWVRLVENNETNCMILPQIKVRLNENEALRSRV